MNEYLNWFKVTIHHPPVAGEAIGALLFEEGAGGLWEDQPDTEGRQVTQAGFFPGAAASLEARLPAIVKNLASFFDCDESDFEVCTQMEESYDWAEKWKEGLEPIVVGPKLAIAPSWWPADNLPRAQAILRIDPGLAFGSGHHASTFMCLQLLSDYAPEARHILDVGAGSGILALAAAALNPEADIYGVDNDPETISVAKENALDNNLAGRVKFSLNQDLSAKVGFDLIVANITLKPLEELAPRVSQLAAAGARLILSGLLEEQLEAVCQAYEPWGWVLERRLSRDEWLGLLLVKGSAKQAREKA